MQTFLPYADFAKCARVLDTKRLNKQILETYQILRAIKGRSKGWRNHPATKMWKNDYFALAAYGFHVCLEFAKRRGKAHAYSNGILRILARTKWPVMQYPSDAPKWASKKMQRMYRSLLIRKDTRHYRKFWPKLSYKIPFVWPDGTVSKS